MSNSKTPKGIVQRVLAALNLGDDGKVMSFFSHVEKATSRDIVNIKANMSAAELEHTQTLEALADDLQDAKQSLKETYENVEVEQIQTNAAQKAYMSIYLNRVKAAEDAVGYVETRIKNVKERYEDFVKAEKAKIAKLEGRLITFGE
jgi:small-conductance mechanosensitive channel